MDLYDSKTHFVHYRLLVPLVQIPVNWEEKGGSKIGRADIWRTLKQVVEIKQRSNFWHVQDT